VGSGDTGAALAENELRRLLEVGRKLVAELDLESVLRHVLETARELTGARYAALGILDERKEELERFLFLGIDKPTRRLIGPFPRGRGVLGELIRRPEPLRLRDVTQHPRSYGFPPGHPPMTSFLGVPILIRGEAFGNLYLTDKARGDFDVGDEQATVILAEWAAIAIDNARLYESVERRRRELERAVRGLEATATIARAVGFETHLERVLELIVKRGRALIDARSLLVLLEQPDGNLEVVATAGDSGEKVGSAVVAGEGTLAGSVLATGAAERVPSLADRIGHGLDAVVGGATAAIVVPLGFRGRARGVLVALDRAEGSPVFDADDEHLLTSFGASAAIAIATAQSVEAERLRHSIRASEAERRRWARELHDETLQELGGLKMLLESARVANAPGVLDDAVAKAVEQLELSISGLQALITELRPAALDQLGVKPALEALLARTTATSGLEISAHIDLASDAGHEPARLSGEIESTIYRLVQEALTNVVKHAQADRAWVEVSEEEQEVTVTVRDNGTGFDPDQRGGGFGLIGMRERAELVNGGLIIESSAERGTTVRVVLPAERADAAPRTKAVPGRRAVTQPASGRHPGR
jgi:signal transduction histidine kinase